MSKVVLTFECPSFTEATLGEIIPGGSSITLELKTDYESGEILCLQNKKSDEFFVRTCLFMKGSYLRGGKVILQPMNLQQYESREVDTKDIVIIGKVKTVVNNIK